MVVADEKCSPAYFTTLPFTAVFILTQLDVRDGKTFILFTILPLPPTVGDSPWAMEESDLDTAVNLITSTVDSSKMMIIVHLEGLIASVEVRT